MTSITKEFDKLAKKVLLCFIFICVLLIFLAYYSLAQVFITMLPSNDASIPAPSSVEIVPVVDVPLVVNVTYNGYQTEPTIQPVVEFLITSGRASEFEIRFEHALFNQTYGSNEELSEWDRSMLLPKYLFGKQVLVHIVRKYPFKEETLTLRLADFPQELQPVLTVM